MGGILNVSKKKPKRMEGKTFKWKKNSRNNTWVKYRKKKKRKR